jgi:pimeloyl-ACP methyl ester carboxylesterase
MNRNIVGLLGVVCIVAVVGRLNADEPTAHTFNADGVQIRYLTQGTAGSPVVLIHGLHSSADMNWRLPGAMAALAKEHRVIALDLPGHGQSDKPDNEKSYGLAMVADVKLLLDQLKIDKAHIVGYSMGGMVAMKFIALHPDRTSTGVLGGMGWLKEGSRLQQFWERIPDRDGARTPTACTRSLAKLALSEDELKSVKTPMTIVVGDRDPVRRLYVAPLETVRKDWPVVEIAGAGHITCIAKREFLDELVKALKDK